VVGVTGAASSALILIATIAYGGHQTVTTLPNITYIFYVFGTLTMEHVAAALKSLREQEPFFWRRFVLFNASDLDSATIMKMVDTDRFGVCEVMQATNRLKSCAADWLEQMRMIEGSDRYLCHKADFYLPPTICRDFERIRRSKGEDRDFIVMFHKYDMKSRATVEDIRRFAHMTWREGTSDPQAGTYQSHLGFLAIPFEQVRGGMDGTLHGYTDGVRELYRPSISELTQRWGVADWFHRLDAGNSRIVIRDPRFFACHMWHESPDRTDWNKNMTPDERF